MLGGTEEDDYLGVGMADALIARLGRSGQVIVRPTRAILKYASLAADPRVAGEELKVERGGGRHAAAGRRAVAGVGPPATDGPRPLLLVRVLRDQFTSLFAVQDAVADQVADALALRWKGPGRHWRRRGARRTRAPTRRT